MLPNNLPEYHSPEIQPDVSASHGLQEGGRRNRTRCAGFQLAKSAEHDGNEEAGEGDHNLLKQHRKHPGRVPESDNAGIQSGHLLSAQSRRDSLFIALFVALFQT